MRVLIIGDVNIIFTYEFITEVLSKIYDIEIDVLNFAPFTNKIVGRDKQLHEIGCNVYYQPEYRRLKKHRILHPIIRLLEAKRYMIARKYDVVNIHFPGIDTWIVPYLIKNETKLITSIYGSDFLRASKRMTRVLSSLFRRSNYITVASKYIENEVTRNTKGLYAYKTIIAKYGSLACKEMHNHLIETGKSNCKELFGIPEKKISILCGYNASEAQRHFDIIDACLGLQEKYKQRIHLMFHCSYGGSPSYIEKLEKYLKTCDISYTVTTEYMQGPRLAKFRSSADVFINIQPTDVLSASMIEELEVGAICIIGGWLSYPDLDEYGAKLYRINNISDLQNELVDIIENLNEYKIQSKVNHGVWNILSWENSIPTWKYIYKGTKSE